MSSDPPPAIALRDVSLAFGDRQVFRNLSCEFPKGLISVILGGSGSGKSTLLKLIGGLVSPQSGQVLVDGQDVTRLSERRLFELRKKLGMMFQNGALLDSMTVFENLALPLREQRRQQPPSLDSEVHDRLTAVGLADVDLLLPGQLSGGMVKRVALARAIIRRPEILLCDEPFSGLDPVSTKRIERLLVDINRRYGMTSIVVSHHIASTMRMADWVLALLPDGIATGSPQDLQRSTDRRLVNFLNEDPDEDLTETDVEVAPGQAAPTR